MSNVPDMLTETATAVLNEMMRGSFFSICDLNKAARLLGVEPSGEAMEILRKLHCVEWRLMPPTLRESIPALISEVLSTPTYTFDLTHRRAPIVADVEPVRVKQGALMRLLNPKS